jgi:hypothetical protein
MIKRFSFDQFLQRTGGWSLIIIVAAVQILSLFGAIPGLISIRFNAEFEECPDPPHEPGTSCRNLVANTDSPQAIE